MCQGPLSSGRQGANWDDQETYSTFFLSLLFLLSLSLCLSVSLCLCLCLSLSLSVSVSLVYLSTFLDSSTNVPLRFGKGFCPRLRRPFSSSWGQSPLFFRYFPVFCWNSCTRQRFSVWTMMVVAVTLVGLKNSRCFGGFLCRCLSLVVALSSYAKILGEDFDESFSSCALFFFLSKLRSTRTHEFHSLGQEQSTVTQRAETTVDDPSLTSEVVSLIGSHTMS